MLKSVGIKNVAMTDTVAVVIKLELLNCKKWSSYCVSLCNIRLRFISS